MFRISGLTMIDTKPTLHSQTTRYHFRYFRRPNGCNCKRPKLQVALFLQISFATLPNQQHKQNLQQSFPKTFSLINASYPPKVRSVWAFPTILRSTLRGRFNILVGDPRSPQPLGVYIECHPTISERYDICMYIYICVCMIALLTIIVGATITTIIV